MIYLLITFLLIGVLPFLVFGLFLAVMQLRAVRDAGRLGQFNYLSRVYADLYLLFGIIGDFLLNCVASFFFMELPQWQDKEWLLSPRVSRLSKTGTPRRKRLAQWVCHGSLQPIDVTHCQ